jgi:hypothetical protein
LKKLERLDNYYDFSEQTKEGKTERRKRKTEKDTKADRMIKHRRKRNADDWRSKTEKKTKRRTKERQRQTNKQT